jgi:hypothetical protein
MIARSLKPPPLDRRVQGGRHPALHEGAAQSSVDPSGHAEGVAPLTALAVAYANYPSRNQPHELRAGARPQAAWGHTDGYIEAGTISLDQLCHQLFSMGAKQVHDAMLDDET